MRTLLWLGLLVLVLGISSLFIAIPHTEKEGIQAGNFEFGVQTRHSERVSPIISAALIAGGIALMIAGGRKRG